MHALRLIDTETRIVPGEPGRDWMDATKIRFANRCLPLLIANQYGWDLIGDGAFSAVWNGGERPEDTVIALGDPAPSEPPISHFGTGILTWNLPFLFRTPPGWNLLARGPVNAPKDGIAPLEGIVETDWASTPFTLNWKITRPGLTVSFEPGEPIGRIVPQRRGELQQFEPVFGAIDEQPAIAGDFRAARAARRAFAADPANLLAWEKHYVRGETPRGERAPEHETRIRLRPFDDPRR